MLRRVPGWRRTTRYRRLESAGPDWLAVHELDSPTVFATPQYAQAASTPWRRRSRAPSAPGKRRLFTHHWILSWAAPADVLPHHGPWQRATSTAAC